ncbi:hypothetical protein, unlikely [Trypanosoma brucei brucei TREU927]|uniref:Uncharacterized protein n=1 Tax=Trypanosoma brucei brucei (strain 927/4 GUTat10.1) TaxID=185431 RepID=Q38DU3_TRYB2|nr:hypothetical protein, unlikely [Trypanosoma brucei brucei TREU927]EAN77027.1 hypothetical protein, unlikely [Trypanosoma brucei brucei TREU927]
MSSLFSSFTSVIFPVLVCPSSFLLFRSRIQHIFPFSLHFLSLLTVKATGAPIALSSFFFLLFFSWSLPISHTILKRMCVCKSAVK